MVHTEELDFQVTNSIQITLHQLQKEHEGDFKLVIMCSSNQHFIASLFHEVLKYLFWCLFWQLVELTLDRFGSRGEVKDGA